MLIFIEDLFIGPDWRHWLNFKKCLSTDWGGSIVPVSILLLFCPFLHHCRSLNPSLHCYSLFHLTYFTVSRSCQTYSYWCAWHLWNKTLAWLDLLSWHGFDAKTLLTLLITRISKLILSFATHLHLISYSASRRSY